MNEELTAALRQVLEEEVCLALRALAVQVTEMKDRHENFLTSLLDRTESMHLEVIALRRELEALREQAVTMPPPPSRLIH